MDPGMPPRELLSFPAWLSSGTYPEPGPPPPGWSEDYDGEPWTVHKARLEWHRARRAWVREHGRSLAAINRLYDTRAGFDPADPDPRRPDRERFITERLNGYYGME